MAQSIRWLAICMQGACDAQGSNPLRVEPNIYMISVVSYVLPVHSCAQNFCVSTCTNIMQISSTLTIRWGNFAASHKCHTCIYKSCKCILPSSSMVLQRNFPQGTSANFYYIQIHWEIILSTSQLIKKSLMRKKNSPPNQTITCFKYLWCFLQ